MGGVGGDADGAMALEAVFRGHEGGYTGLVSFWRCVMVVSVGPLSRERRKRFAILAVEWGGISASASAGNHFCVGGVCLAGVVVWAAAMVVLAWVCRAGGGRCFWRHPGIVRVGELIMAVGRRMGLRNVVKQQQVI